MDGAADESGGTRAAATSADVREKLVEALELDLVGPRAGRAGEPGVGDLSEVLDQAPGRWYLAGFLVPIEADESQRRDETSQEELAGAGEGGGGEEGETPEPASARPRYLPSSAGLSVLVPPGAASLTATARWGDYARVEGHPNHWARTPRQGVVELSLPADGAFPVPDSGGLEVHATTRPAPAGESVEAGTRVVSAFLVNRRPPAPDVDRDAAYAFQAELEVSCGTGVVARPDAKSLGSGDWDERVADLQFRDACEYATGHNCATMPVRDAAGRLTGARTCWVPRAEVERVEPAKIEGVMLSMDELAALPDAASARRELSGFVEQYRRWIETQRGATAGEPEQRRKVADELLDRARVAADRMEKGIDLLERDAGAFEAFRLANKAMAESSRRRAVIGGRPAGAAAWRPFQLAFLLMNLRGLAEPGSQDREVVDLLFFPTGGGKTEAYLGLAAFTLVLRRLRNPAHGGIGGAGVAVLMRYTLRLLTLDQLGRAATLICALELERRQDVEKLGTWPFEIGLWVGKAATPNHMGFKGDKRQDTARAKTIAKRNDARKPSPIPLEECPWCGTRFTRNSFELRPNSDKPTDLHLRCVSRDCRFNREGPLPVLGVDEPIYRRLPCFLIATVDKFAALPWTGEVGALFGRVSRHDRDGFYGPCDPERGRPLPEERLPPPDLIVQDELHLISGPLGTMVGLYETAIDALCRDGAGHRPKVVASTATVRRAEAQIRALFGRALTDVFPPPGPDRRDSFFAKTVSSSQTPARLYVGIAGQGRSPKVVMLRAMLAVMAAAQKQYEQHGAAADPYLTMLGYFNALRELGGARRIVEDEVVNQLKGRSRRLRVGETDGPFADRQIGYEPVELTSRVSTADVADAKRRLAVAFHEKDGKKDRVDVAIATNMISVGLDITRLGMMLVMSQPKTASEYIQATSRVGREKDKPGLVVTVLNVHKPRDRSHYERFGFFHESFYRHVEATSVTPFSPRALDRGLAGTLVGLARQGHDGLTPPTGAGKAGEYRTRLDAAAEVMADRAATHADWSDSDEADRLRRRVRERCEALLDEWVKLAGKYRDVGAQLQYQREEGGAKRLLYEFLNPELEEVGKNYDFRANRSMRDVEPSVNLRVRRLDGEELEDLA